MVQYRRTKYFIDLNIQGSLAQRIILHYLTFLSVAFVVAFMLQVLIDPFRPLSAHLHDMWWSHRSFVLTMALMLPVFVFDLIKLSHRFTGPIVNLRCAIREVVAGHRPRQLKFRQNDFWQDLAQDYNVMLARLGVLEDEKSKPAADVEPENSNQK